MTAALEAVCDTSVIVKWFRDSQESEVPQARAMLRAHVAGQLRAYTLDLVQYELGNALLRTASISPPEIQRALGDLQTLLGDPLHLDPEMRELAVELAAKHDLTFYDAAHLSAARILDCPLVSADSALIAAGALSAGAFCEQSGLADQNS